MDLTGTLARPRPAAESVTTAEKNKPFRRPAIPPAAIWRLILPGSVLVILLVLPLGALLWRAGQTDWPAAFSDPAARQALKLSLWTSALSLVTILFTGTPLAYILARWEFRGRALLEVLLDLPVVLPPSVAGLALLMAFGRRGILGPGISMLGIALPFTSAAVIMAQIFVAGPLYVRAARIGFAAIDPQLEEAASTEGADSWQLFTRVMLPVALPSLIAGAALSWTRALGEFGATLFFAGNLAGRTQTMPLLIYLGFEQNSETALALSAVLFAVSFTLLALLRRFGQH
jgi:molybdate transport system permease protein